MFQFPAVPVGVLLPSVPGEPMVCSVALGGSQAGKRHRGGRGLCPAGGAGVSRAGAPVIALRLQ